LDDGTEPREVTVYSEVLEASRGKIVTDEVLVVEAKVSNDDFSGGLRINADRLLTLGEARSRFARALSLRIDGELAASGGAAGAAGKLQTLLEPFREGGCPIRVRYRNAAAEAELPLGDGWRVRLDDALLESLREWLPGEAVEVVYP
ncbi:DNA polymerase III subunit alpha, partial [Thauera sp. UPWRP]